MTPSSGIVNGLMKRAETGILNVATKSSRSKKVDALENMEDPKKQVMVHTRVTTAA